jgi:hypothetical protein
MLELQNGVRIPELVYPKLLKIRAKINAGLGKLASD